MLQKVPIAKVQAGSELACQKPAKIRKHIKTRGIAVGAWRKSRALQRYQWQELTAIAKPSHSITSPKKFAPLTSVKNPPAQQYPIGVSAQYGINGGRDKKWNAS